jgi:hypothetical protein
MLQGGEDSAAQAKPIVLQTTEVSTRLDKQIKRGGVVDLDYDKDLGLKLLLRGHAKQGLFVAILNKEANSSVFCGMLQPGWAAAYLNKAGATAKFALTTQSAAAAELAKLGMPELTLLKEAKKGIILHIAEIPMLCCCFFLMELQ